MKENNPLTKINPGVPFPIVGLGASAGGLDSLQRFLSVLPIDFGFALVFIQHLSSKHKSLLSELLSARRPSLVIQEIFDGLKAQHGRLYLSPPGKEVRLRNGFFQTTVHIEGLIHLPIDEFLTSLAEDAGDRSIAVIFSGAGTDGARGCHAVRAAGGMVFVQDPQTAGFNSMPLAAIATGQADAVLSPEDIAAELLKLQGIEKADVSREYLITTEEFDTFFRLLQEKTGSRFNNYKKGVVNRRIRRRMYLHGLSTVKDYLDLITTNDSEAARLASDLMIGVTSFFRDQVAWKALHLEAVRKITAENTNLPVRVWTPASATGEEAYSIAMMLLRELTLTGQKRDIQVFASDVNDRALEQAREGKYPASITADVTQEYAQKYFTPTDDGDFLVINKEVRECVVFARQDLLTDPPFSKLDLIICRNFLIYLEPEAQEKSIALFHYALKEGGYLFLGNAETVGRKSALFKSIGHKQCRIYRKLEMKLASRLPTSVPYATKRQVSPANQPQITERIWSVTESIQEKLLERYGPAAVAIDQNYDIIYHNGPTKRYLSQPRGVPTQNLLELLPKNLHTRIRGALYQSGREERLVSIHTIIADDDNCKRQVSLQITKAQENLYIVVFQEKGVSSKKEAVEQVNASVIEETAIHQLENELAATRADLQSHIEQLKSMNEEFHSSNEELKAANEELETSREELQSLNEELITVNSQLQGKIEEQDATNNDLHNFQASTNIPTIFLDTDFRVKRFTPAMLKLIKLLPSDVGRPIVDMSQENLGPDLTSEAKSVLKQLTPLRRELEINGAWYARNILPYRTEDNRIEGVVVTYNDVTELKRAEEQFRTLADSIPNLAWWANGDGYITWYNRRWYDYTGTTPEQMEGWGWQSVHDPKVLPTVLERWKTSITTGEPFDMEFPLRGSDGVFRPFLTRVMPLKDSTGLVLRWFGTNTDISALRQAEEAQGRLAAIVQSADVAIIGKDLNGIIQTWNVGAENIFGYKAEEVIGKPISILVPPGHIDEVPEILSRIKQGKQIENYETVRIRKDGTIIPVSLKFSAIKDATGRIIGASKIAHDITARKQAEEALREGAVKYKLLTESIVDSFTAIDRNLRYTYWNKASEELTGISSNEAIGKTRLELFGDNEETRNNFSYLRECMKTRQPVQYETEATFGDRKHLFNIRLFPTIDGVSILGRDITDQRMAEEALRLSEKKFATAFANNPAAIAMTRLDDGLFLDVNDTWVAMNGYSRDEVIGLSARQLPIWPSAEAAARFVQQLREKGILRGWEQEFLRKSGEIFIAQLSAQILIVQGEQVILSTMVDITERKKAEEAVRKSEARYRGLFENMIEGFAYCKMIFENGKPKDFIYLSVNHAFESLTGLNDVVGKRVTEVIPGIREADPGLFEIYGRVSLTGKPERFEMFVEALKMWFSISVYSPEKEFFVAVFDVITERKKAEEAQGHLSAIIESAEDAIIGKDLNGIIQTWNVGAENIFGYKAEEVIGRPISFLIPPGHTDKVPEILARIKQGEHIENFETVRLRKDGTIIPVSLTFSAIKDTTGKIIGASKIAHDITARKRTEEALREREERLRRFYESSLIGVIYWNMDGVVMDANDQFLQLVGYTRQDLAAGRIDWINMTPPEYRHLDEQSVAELKAVGVNKKPLEKEYIRKDGTRIPIIFAGAMLDEARYNGVAFVLDITERKKAEANVIKLSENMAARNVELEFANREMESFIYSVSHDLRAPLRTISGFSKILIEDCGNNLENQQKDYLTRIANASKKMGELIEDLLRLSRISKQDMNRIDYDLSMLTSTIAAGLREADPGRKVKVAIAEGLRASVDPNLIRIALANLIENAWKFTSKTKDARIEFSAFEKDGKTVYSVRDNGAGFDQTYADKMFHPFQRLHSEKEFEGTGIGLAIVERIIRRHGGAVWAEGEVGKGATVYFTLGV